MRATAAGLGESEHTHLLSWDLDGIERNVMLAPLCHSLYVYVAPTRTGWGRGSARDEGGGSSDHWASHSEKLGKGFSDSSILLQESAKGQGINSSPPGKGDGGVCFSHSSCSISSLSGQFPSGWGRQED